MPHTYAVGGKPGYIVRFAEADLKPQTCTEVDDGFDAISIGEYLIKNTNAVNYWIIDRETGKICWGNI